MKHLLNRNTHQNGMSLGNYVFGGNVVGNANYNHRRAFTYAENEQLCAFAYLFKINIFMYTLGKTPSGEEIPPYWTIITPDTLLTNNYGPVLGFMNEYDIKETKQKIREYPTLFCWNVYNVHFKLMIPKNYPEHIIPDNYSLIKEYHKHKESVIKKWNTTINREEIMQFYLQSIARAREDASRASRPRVKNTPKTLTKSFSRGSSAPKNISKLSEEEQLKYALEMSMIEETSNKSNRKSSKPNNRKSNKSNRKSNKSNRKSNKPNNRKSNKKTDSLERMKKLFPDIKESFLKGILEKNSYNFNQAVGYLNEQKKLKKIALEQMKRQFPDKEEKILKTYLKKSRYNVKDAIVSLMLEMGNDPSKILDKYK